jgi:hypothetical protein
MAQDGNATRAEFHFVLAEGPPDRRLASEHVEELVRDTRPAQPFRPGAAGEIQLVGPERRHPREAMVVIAEIAIVPRRQRKLRESGLEVPLANHHQFLWTVEPKRLQEDGIYHREDRAIRADTEGECEH